MPDDVTVSDGNYILVVDDEESIRSFVEVALMEEGYNVTSVSNGQRALDVIKDRPPQLILLDMRMPLMDGWEFASQYHAASGPHAPIVALTAARDDSQRDSQIEAAAFLAKPFNLDDLFTLVERFVPSP